MVTVRYIVHDVDKSIEFYTKHLDFAVEMHPAPSFAMLSRGELRLLSSAPSNVGGGGQTMSDGRKPEPGGWNRFEIVVNDLAGQVGRLQKAGIHFWSAIVTGIGGNQILLDDPSGIPLNCSNQHRSNARKHISLSQ